MCVCLCIGRGSLIQCNSVRRFSIKGREEILQRTYVHSNSVLSTGRIVISIRYKGT